MKLGRYLKSIGKTTDEFAKEISVSGATVRRYVLGTRTPRNPVQIRIRDVTRGKVGFRDWDPEPELSEDQVAA